MILEVLGLITDPVTRKAYLQLAGRWKEKQSYLKEIP
jgi:hypothetical protein